MYDERMRAFMIMNDNHKWISIRGNPKLNSVIKAVGDANSSEDD